MNIDFSPPGIHGLECKNYQFTTFVMMLSTSLFHITGPLCGEAAYQAASPHEGPVMWSPTDLGYTK